MKGPLSAPTFPKPAFPNPTLQKLFVERLVPSRAGFLRAAALVAVVTFVGCSAGESVKLSGYVLSSKTDENDNPVDIYLFDGSSEYPIEKNSAQEQLLDLVDQKVQVEGTVESTFSGKKSVTVERFKRLEE